MFSKSWHSFLHIQNPRFHNITPDSRPGIWHASEEAGFLTIQKCSASHGIHFYIFKIPGSIILHRASEEAGLLTIQKCSASHGIHFYIFKIPGSIILHRASDEAGLLTIQK